MDIFEVGGVSLLIAFVAGMLSVASPCVLPLVPAYLGYLTGTALEGSSGGQTVATVGAGGAGGSVAVASAPPRDSAPSPFLHSVAFVSGFSVIFILFGISLGLVGFFLRDNLDLILRVAGVMLIVMGLHLAGVITIPWLEQERRLDVGRGAKVGYARSFAVGSAFSAGWSPCIGPTLGAVFALSVSGGSVLEAGVLFGVYSLGLSIPFLALGLAYSSVKPLYMRAKRYMGIVNYISGAMLIVIGILIFTDSLINLNSAFNFWPFTEIAQLEEGL
ncbi:MAG: cytochrome c biogenesis protein CcdA [Chloroflexi bacterium]|nr:cytochrome c biogenesis protein CcdA [Chloroflexota bacterium]MCH7953933.1 cytochrome c biogenesis protein CcdA [Chloroflexota bacterium]MCH8200297.1 cytochrome c biogenesis protein CcdA [Chloroflexota bacterium]MCI0783112.1 cytochrome c biogenesis protein CcdA [Chloroflexota bacterium]MCI0813764.1 cytochrome c biogenesis protein CcdA [Chloroflexota bacterium]